MTQRSWLIHLGEGLVGTAQLMHYDAGMNVRFGPFSPGPAYSQVQDVFQLFYSADEDPALLSQYYAKRDSLGLVVSDESGTAQSVVVHIVDCTADYPDEPLEVTLTPE